MSTVRRVIRGVPKRESSDNSSLTSSASFLFKISIEEKEESDKYGETPHPHLSLSPSSNSSLPNQPRHRINHHKQHNNNNSSHFYSSSQTTQNDHHSRNSSSRPTNYPAASAPQLPEHPLTNQFRTTMVSWNTMGKRRKIHNGKEKGRLSGIYYNVFFIKWDFARLQPQCLS